MSKQGPKLLARVVVARASSCRDCANTEIHSDWCLFEGPISTNDLGHILIGNLNCPWIIRVSFMDPSIPPGQVVSRAVAPFPKSV
jgi:hypothetical protein